MIMKQVVCGVLALSLFGGTIHVPVAKAALIGTEQVIATVETRQGAEQARQHLNAVLARDEVVAQLQEYGVDPMEAQARVDRLSDEEAVQLAGQIDQLPAGGSILGAAVFVFLVLLVTDLLGLADIFPFVNK